MVAGQIGSNGNIAEDPLFCGEDWNPYRPYLVHGDSPCAPENNPECGLIGAWPVGCGAPQSAEGAAVGCSRFFLGSNVPNPLVSSTRIAYTIPSQENGSPALLNVYDAGGRLIRTLVDVRQHPGRHSVNWDATNQAGRPVEGGVYFYRLSVGGETMTRRILLVR